MKKWLVICGICAALLAAAAVYVFRPVRLDTSGVQLRRALRDTAPDYEPFEVDVRLYDAGGERVCEADMCWGRIRMDGASYAVGSGSAKEVNALIDAVRELVE